MTLDEAMDDKRVVTRAQAERECRKHTLDPSEMFAELGDHTMTKYNDQLLPCPFCGSTKAENRHDDGIAWTRCKSCGATGPELSRYSGEEGEPRTDWNTRAKLPAGGSVPDGMVAVTKEDGSNYCLILSALGMEEEGDPVEEVRRLLASPPAAQDVSGLIQALEHYAGCGKSGNVARVALAAHRAQAQGGDT